MINISLSINGEPVAEGDLVGAFERAAIEGIRKDFARKLDQALSAEELGKIKVELAGKDLSSLMVNLSGPTEIILKARQALEAK
jgi:hypothetical protein